MESQLKGLTPTQQLKLCRDMTARLGVVHEAQRLQVQYLPFAVDPDLPINGGSKCVLEPDVKKMVYEWTDQTRPAGWRPSAAYLLRLRRVSYGIKTVIFGEDWHFEVRMNGETIYQSVAGHVDVVSEPKRKASRKPRHPRRAAAGRKRRRK